MIRGDASGTTLVAGKGGLFAFVPPKITVDVRMDKAQIPAPIVNVTVKLDSEELRHIISEEIANTKG